MKNQDKIDIAVLGSRMGNVEEEIKQIRENHLVHINDRLIGIETKLAYYSGAIAVLIVIFQILNSGILKLLWKN